jgi:hypothetical protein
LVQAFLKKWWVESDFKAPNCSLLQDFVIITCSFSVLVENCILLPKSINELNIVEILLQSAFFFSYKIVASRRQTSHSHYGSKVPAVTITVFKYRNKIGKIVVKAVPYSVL